MTALCKSLCLHTVTIDKSAVAKSMARIPLLLQSGYLIAWDEDSKYSSNISDFSTGNHIITETLMTLV